MNLWSHDDDGAAVRQGEDDANARRGVTRYAAYGIAAGV